MSQKLCEYLIFSCISTPSITHTYIYYPKLWMDVRDIAGKTAVEKGMMCGLEIDVQNSLLGAQMRETKLCHTQFIEGGLNRKSLRCNVMIWKCAEERDNEV
jgi:hypothetical protein